MRSLSLLAATAWLSAAFGSAPALATAARNVQRIAGVNAVPGAPGDVAATLIVRKAGPLAARLDVSERSRGRTLRDYAVDMTQRQHLIVIGDDFQTFSHLHPVLHPNGHFTLDLRVPRPGRYYVYADADPRGFGKRVFRFSLAFGNAVARGPEVALTRGSVRAGPYDVNLQPLTLRAHRATTMRIRIRVDGRPAGDLQPYLGGAAHAVFVDARTLGYVHVHPSSASGGTASMPDMSSMRMEPAEGTLKAGDRVGPDMSLHVLAPAVGTYKLWLQFRGHGRLWVAPFGLRAR